MQRTAIILACFFVCVNGFSQQYPFVHYTPKQGLINSRVRRIRQDSNGRMLFITFGGLSIYDGTRFINYSQQDGLANEVINDVAEAGPDSFLVATNSVKLNTLVKGRVDVFKTVDGFYPVVNHFLKSSEGDWYVIADEGLFMLKDRKFIHLPLLNKEGIEIGKNLEHIIEWKNFLFLMPWSNLKERLIVYDKQSKKTVTISTDHKILNIIKDKNNQLWVSVSEGIKWLDTIAMIKGNINLLSLPPVYSFISHINSAIIFFDADNNLWLNDAGELKILSLKSHEQLITIGKDLPHFILTGIMQDREGTIWIASDGKGVIKIPGGNTRLITGFLPGHSIYISTLHQQNDTTWLFNSIDNTILRLIKNDIQSFPLQMERINAGSIHIINKNLYLTDYKNLFYITDKDKMGSYRYPRNIFLDSITSLGISLTDAYGAIIMAAQSSDYGYRFLVIKGNKKIMEYPLSVEADQVALDKKNRLWVTARNSHVMVFALHPEKPSQYLQLLKDFTNELPVRDPRSITIDKNNNVWVGTRYSGLFCLKFDDLTLQTTMQFTTKNGLTDNFIYSLTCDNDNVIWIGTQTGLDKIFLKNEQYVVGNISKTNNFFQAIWKIIAKKDSTIWALTNEGTILQAATNWPVAFSSPPSLLLTSLKINGQSVNEYINNFSYKQNNLTFNVAAPSFIDEKSVLYSYVLKGSGNDSWSEPSNNSVLNFVNLVHGKYTLQIRSDFPEFIYPSQHLSFTFTIQPPWWQTWWFRIGIGVLGICILTYGIRFYYRRKMEKQKNILEKQQAIEQERSRIAADMHDDLGAGLTNIRYITEHILEKTESGETVKPELEKLKNFSSELVESMGEIIWAVSEKNNLLSNTLYYLRSYSINYCEENDLECYFEIPENFRDRIVSGNIRRNIFLLLKESLHNIVKHAGAKNITISAAITEELKLVIKDDGKGFSDNGDTKGNGLINMKKRVQELNGSISFDNDPGATVIIHLPFDTNQRTIG
jgi:signal transduction histidine kinase/ligand-binding sensor domain-containing protein